MPPEQVLDFWFEELPDEDRWRLGKKLDQPIADRFGEIHRAAAVGELWMWRERPEGRLAEIIVLDQFSRHIFRNTPAAFTSDPLALILAQESVRSGADKIVGEDKRLFFYMPFMHSESLKIHESATGLFSKLEGGLKYENDHKRLVERFGRYPHRNAILGRVNSPEEEEYLKDNASFGGQG
ncbi:MAG: DUF924 family protein [Stellaceae bacterium]